MLNKKEGWFNKLDLYEMAIKADSIGNNWGVAFSCEMGKMLILMSTKLGPEFIILKSAGCCHFDVHCLSPSPSRQALHFCSFQKTVLCRTITCHSEEIFKTN